MINIIDGRKISEEIRGELKNIVGNMKRKPCLAVILVGEDAASMSYVKGKEKACKEIGIESRMIFLPPTVSKYDIIEQIRNLNYDRNVDGILVQLPLPDGINTNEIIEAIMPDKDVDGFTAMNIGDMILGNYKTCFIPCTPYGITKLIEKSGLNLYGKIVTVIGRSNIVGRPIVNILSTKKYNATVLWANSKTVRYDLERMCGQSDCIIVACGKPGVIDYHWIPPRCTVIDVGVNRIKIQFTEGEHYRLVGDVYDNENNEMMEYFHKNNISITPVPGGVGPMTITMLMNNVIKSAVKRNSIYFGEKNEVNIE